MAGNRKRPGVEAGGPVVAARVEEALLRAGIELFARQGFDATSVQEIVAAARVTKGAMYHYFASKEDLLYEIDREFIAHLLQGAADILERGTSPDVTLRELMVSLVESVARFQASVTVFVREMHRLPPDKLAAVQAQRQRYFAVFVDVIRQGQVCGVFRSDVNATIGALTLYGACHSVHTWYNPGGAWSARELGQQMAWMSLVGLSGNLPRPRHGHARDD